MGGRVGEGEGRREGEGGWVGGEWRRQEGGWMRVGGGEAETPAGLSTLSTPSRHSPGAVPLSLAQCLVVGR